MRILDHINVGENHQTLQDHLVENGNDGPQLLLGIDSGQQDGRIVREIEGRILVNAAIGSVSEDATVDGDPGDIVGAHGLHQRVV